MKSLFQHGIASQGVVTVLVLVTAQPSHAGVRARVEVPAAAPTVRSLQLKVEIDFDGGLESYFSAIPVTDATGKSIRGGKATVDLSNPEHMAVMLRPLTPYAVIWVAVTADGRRTEGEEVFRVK
jgi:copper resistance protein C